MSDAANRTGWLTQKQERSLAAMGIRYVHDPEVPATDAIRCRRCGAGFEEMRAFIGCTVGRRNLFSVWG